MTERTGGHAVARVLADRGFDRAYVLLGGQTVTIADGLVDRGVDVVSARHEYNAAVMADTEGRLTGQPGVAVTVAGPGGTNALTGVAQAYTAASPMLLISAVPPADAPTEVLHGVDDSRFLEQAFEPATKWSTQVHDPDALLSTLHSAIDRTTNGRPGPVFVGVEDRILEAAFPVDDASVDRSSVTGDAPSPEVSAEAIAPIREASRRALYVGKGVLRAFASKSVVDIAETLDCPVVCPRFYPDAYPNDDERWAGTVGMSDHPAAIEALGRAEAVLSIGVRASSHEAAVLGERTPDSASLVYLDTGDREPPATDAAAIVAGDLAAIISEVRDHLAASPGATDPDYRRAVRETREAIDDAVAAYHESVREDTPINPIVVMHALRAVADDDVVITGDAGAAGGAWPNDAFEYRVPNSFQHSRLFDSMGFPVPAGVAAKLVEPDRQLVNLVGDGGFLMCNMELATVVETGVDGVTLVMNDSAYGMIKQTQRARELAEVATDIPPTDIAAMAEAYGVTGVRVESPGGVRPALEDALAADEHVVLDVVTDPDADYVSRTIW